MLVAVFAVLVTVPSLVLGVYLWRLGAHIVRAERFPPPGSLVIRDTLITVGDNARRVGRLVQIGAVVIAATSVAMPLILWWLISLC